MIGGRVITIPWPLSDVIWLVNPLEQRGEGVRVLKWPWPGYRGGIVQGSVLGPILLFCSILFIDGLPFYFKKVNVNVINFTCIIPIAVSVIIICLHYSRARFPAVWTAPFHFPAPLPDNLMPFPFPEPPRPVVPGIVYALGSSNDNWKIFINSSFFRCRCPVRHNIGTVYSSTYSTVRLFFREEHIVTVIIELFWHSDINKVSN